MTTYRSTRGQANGWSFEDVVLGGLAPDSGLFVPESIPTMTPEAIEGLRGKPFEDIAYAVISSFVSPEQIPTDDLKRIIKKSYATFRHADRTPSVQYKDFWVLELFHGPTFAFKDVALQFLGNLFEFFLKRGNKQKSITILGATSGDTGSAAIHGLRGKENVNCFILYPKGKVTDIQERQMTSITDENVHCIQVEGNFDDCQALVKKAFADPAFRKEVNLGAINSINWARVMAQITYYFYSYLQITAPGSRKTVSYAVPTGNFGDILAGYYAKRMGLPVGKLVIATNENDVLHRFLLTGKYTKKTCNPTIAPSMDISVSSNFERYMYYLADGDASVLAGWMKQFEKTGAIGVSEAQHRQACSEFASYAAGKDEIVKKMTDMYKTENYLLCPHTATAAAAIPALHRKSKHYPRDTTVVLATAHPAKFEEAVDLALGAGHGAARPNELEILFALERRRYQVANDVEKVKGFVRTNMIGGGGTGVAAGGGAFGTILNQVITAASVAFIFYAAATKKQA
jgi:threonine synthase